MFMINFCWDLDCPKQKVIRGVFSSCKTKSICTFFGNMLFENVCYDIGLRVFARFLAICFSKMFVMTLFEFSPARSLLAEEEKSS